MQFNMRHEFSDDTLANVIDGSDIGYWADIEGRWPGATAILAGTDYAVLRENDRECQKYRLTAKSIAKGLQLMAAEYPRFFAQIVSDDYDCETGDVLVQLAVFGELVYG